MTKITCEDIKGQKYSFDETEFIKNTRAYGVYIKDNKILLIKDPQGASLELPGGGLEEGESFQEGLKREFFEETGLKIAPNPKFITNFQSYFYNMFKKQPWDSDRRFYLVNVHSGTLLEQGNGHDAEFAKFFPLSDLDKLPIKPEIKQVISQAIELLASN